MKPIAAALNRFKLNAQAFWIARTGQEQKFLTVGGGALALALLYSLLIAPALDGRAKLQKDLPQLRQEAADMAALARQARELASQSPVAAAPLGRDALNASLAARGLTPQSVSMTGDYVRVQLAGVPFPSLMQWLDALRREHHVTVQEATIGAQAAPGVVDAAITLHQGEGAAR